MPDWRATPTRSRRLQPNAGTARHYLTARTNYWNTGICVLGARAFLHELARLAPADERN